MTTIQRLFALIQSFPTLWEYATEAQKEAIEDCFEWGLDKPGDHDGPIPIAFDVEKFAKYARRICVGGHGRNCAARFVLSVWNYQADRDNAYRLGQFDLHEAMGCWDPGHREAFGAWVHNPFWC